MTLETSSAKTVHHRGLIFAMLCLSLLLGAWECVYGRVGYSADAINYLNIVRAIHAGDWQLALNSYWGFGYPLLISFVTPIFPDTPTGEWIAIHVLNMVIFIATFFSFLWLVKVAAHLPGLSTIAGDEKSSRLLLIGSLAIFLSIELSLDNASRVGPDMLVSCLLFEATALLLMLREKPKATTAILLGITLGIGYVVKSIFLPLTMLFLLTACIAMGKKRGNFASLALIAIFAAVFAIPYHIGISWSAGHPTFGDSGPLNYIWNVNKLEPGGLWQGQPPQFGTPVHPTKMVSEMPHLYLLDGPFHVTFSPFFNLPYYYAGVHRFFNLKAQIHAIGSNILRMLKLVETQMIFVALLVCWLLSSAKVLRERTRSHVIAVLWPMLFTSICGISIYLLVVVEYRYVASFIAMLLLGLLFAVVSGNAIPRAEGRGSRRTALLTAILVFGCMLNLILSAKDQVRDWLGNTIHHRLFNNEDQWIAGQYLAQTGSQPGDKVAIISDLPAATMSTWAYIDDLHIVGILGGSLLQSQTIDYDAFWNASADRQEALLENFHHTGARIVFSTQQPRGADASKWQQIPNTRFWIYRFQ